MDGAHVLAGADSGPLDDSVPALVADCVRRWPDRVAIVDLAGARPPSRLTYRELSQRCRTLAARLRGLGVGRGDVVALAMRRGADLVTAELGVMAVGATYLPLDGADPSERLQRILEHSGVVALLADRSWAVREVPVSDTVAVHEVDESWFAWAGAPDAPEELESSTGPDDDAYLLYTSGSSGQPKGVRISHRAMVNLLTWHHRARPDTEGMPSAQLCAVSFDFSVHETFAPLACGGTLVVLDEACRTDAVRLLEQVARHGVQRLFLPVPLLELLAETARSQDLLPRLAHLVTTGEQLRLSPAVRDLVVRTGARLHNHYGATEFQDATVHTLPPDVGTWPAVAPIGLPIPGVSVVLLDDEGRPVELTGGATGELCVGGVGVAEGYHRAPDLSAERFLAPVGVPGQWYRTGDLAQVNAAGLLEHRGRRDDQLKVSGIRVEPAEVEAAVLAHPDVVGAAAVVRDPGGSPRLVVHVVLGAGVSVPPPDLAEVVASRLPVALRPFGYVVAESIPLTASGKTDRRALPVDAPVVAPPRPGPGERPRNPGERRLAGLWAEVLGRDVDDIDVLASFADLGGGSADLLEVARRSESDLGAALTVRELVAMPTVRALNLHLERAQRTARLDPVLVAPVATPSPQKQTVGSAAVAVIGMAVRFPGASDLPSFWRNLVDGVDSVEDLTEDQLDAQDPALREHPDFVGKAAALTDADCFDAGYFGLSPREAALMDPQHRVFLECAVSAFEDAGEVPDGTRTGVYAASSISTYLLNAVLPGLGYGSGRPFTEADSQQLLVRLGNDRNYLPTRVSHRLDLRGPSMAVQSACSSSLVAVHVARRALLDRECYMALAGGVSIIDPLRGGYVWEDAMIRSRDGRSRAFSADASGTLFASGCGIVLLKRHEDAVRDGNRVYAVLVGSAVNNDGRDKLGFTAPHEGRQAEVVAAAMAEAGVDATRLGYVEAHGTGTQIGDPIEIGGLDRAVGSVTAGSVPAGEILLGSVKTNIGHLDEAAGVAGLVKSVLAVHHGVVPASLHFASPNPAIDFGRSAFSVATATVPWPEGRPRIAGVSSHGMGGTNAHVVLAAPSAVPAPAGQDLDLGRDGEAGEGHDRPGPDDLVTVLPVSARSAEAATELGRRYAGLLRWFDDGPDAPDLGDVAHAAARGRRTHPWRLCAVGSEPDEVARVLEQATPVDGRPGGLAWAFAGQGAQEVGMAHAAYQRWPVVRDVLDHSADVVRSLTGVDLRAVMFEGAEDLDRTRWAQPALVASGLALARLWQSWGVTPDAVLGHSVGEITAATVAGVLDLDDALRLVVARAGLMDQLPEGGAMLAVRAGLGRTRDLLSTAVPDIDIAAINHPGSVVVSGSVDEIATAAAELRRAGIDSQRLRVSHAFHSALMEPVLPSWAAALGEFTFRAPTLPLVANVTGRSGTELDATYWQRHVREPVQFAASVDHLVDELGVTTVLEVAARPVLGPLLARDGVDVLTTAEPGRDVRRNLESLAAVYLLGHDVEWAGVHPGPGRHVDLPAYPWRRDRHQLEPVEPREPAAYRRAGSRFLGSRVEQPGSQEVRYVNELAPDAPEWLHDHRIFSEVVMPGVALQDLALAAAVDVGAASVLLDVVVERAMVFHGGESRQVHVVVTDGDHSRIEVHSRPSAGGEWQRHLTCRTADDAEAEAATSARSMTPLSQLHEELSRAGDVEEIYRGESRRGIDLGPSFRVTERLWTSAGRCLSEIGLPARITDAGTRHVVHPVLLEACLLALTVTYPDAVAERSFVPVGAERVRVLGPVRGDRHWCHARLRPGHDGLDDTLVGDLELLDADGRLLVAWDGVLLRTASAASMVSRDLWRSWVHRSGWEPAEPPTSSLPSSSRWLVLQPYDDGLAAHAGRLGVGSVRTAPLEPLCDQQGPDRTGGGELADLVVVRADLVEGYTAPALAVTQVLRDRLSWAEPGHVVVVTRGAHPVDGGEAVRTGQSAVWGVVRSVAAEHPDLPLRAVDVSAAGPDDLVRELRLVTDDEVALAGSRRLVHRLRTARPAGPEGPDRTGTHVVTGGWGGIGLELVDRLVGAGNRHVVLVGRRAPAPAAAARVEGWRTDGAEIRVVTADAASLADPAWVSDLLDELEETMPPVVAVHHLAGALADAVLANQTPDSFDRTWQAKAAPARAFDLATRRRDLDSFVLYSSSSGLLGTPGQANYAAANTALDAIAAERNAAGLPGISIQWGSWADVGMSARQGLQARLRETGEGTIPVEQGLDAHLVLARTRGVVAVLPHQWSVVADSGAPVPASVLPLLPAAGARARVNPGRREADLVESLRSAHAARRRRLLADAVHDQVAGVLGLRSVERDLGFFSLGGDSLSSLELRRRLNDALGHRFAQSLVFDHPTVDDLVDHIAGELDLDLGNPEPEAASLAQDVVEARLLAKLARGGSGRDARP